MASGPSMTPRAHFLLGAAVAILAVFFTVVNVSSNGVSVSDFTPLVFGAVGVIGLARAYRRREV